MFREQHQISRRRFLRTIGAGAAIYGAMPGQLLADVVKNPISSTKIDLSFVDKNGVGPYIDAPYVEDLFVPLHKEVSLPPMDESTVEYQSARKVLRSELEAAGVDWSDDYQLSWTYQHYGAADKNKEILGLVDYCSEVQSYLYNSIEGLTNFDFDWRALNDSMDVVDKRGTTALVGKHTYFVLRVSALDEDGNALEPYLVNAQPVNRAIHYIGASDGDQLHPDQRVIYVIRGATSLVSPFSEMIHMSTHNPAMRYAGELKQDHEKNEAKSLARNSGETVTESAAVLMALDYLHEIGLADRAKQVVRHAKSLSNQLPEFSHSIEYMQKYGVQTALEAYLNSPNDYMKAISKMG